VGALFEKYGSGEGKTPLWIDGKESILEMEVNKGPSWKEVEWPGFYIKYLLQKFCLQNPDCKIVPYNNGKRHFIKGNFLWDTRVHDFKKNEIPLGDIRQYDDLISSNNGIGVILVNAEISTDKSGNFRSWHDSLKGNSSKYLIQGKQLGRRERPRKEKILIKQVSAYFLRSGDLERGITEGWATDRFQGTMKNATLPKRNKKYEILKSKIPSENLLFTKNF
jgi:hypothetical protein